MRSSRSHGAGHGFAVAIVETGAPGSVVSSSLVLRGARDGIASGGHMTVTARAIASEGHSGEARETKRLIAFSCRGRISDRADAGPEDPTR